MRMAFLTLEKLVPLECRTSASFGAARRGGVAVTVGSLEALTVDAIVEGSILPEPVEVIATMPMGSCVRVIGRGIRTNQVHQPVLDATQLAQLAVSPREEPFDGDAQRFRLGIEAQWTACSQGRTGLGF